MTKNKLLVLVILFMVFITLGMPDSLLSSSWNQVRMDYQVPLSYLGIITFTSYLMIITSIGLGPKLLQVIKEKHMALAGVLLSSLALFVISFSNEFYVMVLCAIPIGLGRGLLDYSVNHYMSVRYKTQAMNFLHSMFGFGVILAPFVMAYTLRDGNWRLGFLLIGGLMLALSLVLLFSLGVFEDGDSFGEEEHHHRVPVKELLNVTGTKLNIVLFIFITHLESLGGVWFASYFFITNDITVALAATFTSTYFIGLTASRFLSGVFASKIKPETSLTIGFTTMFLAGAILFLWSGHIVIGFVATFLYGFGAGPNFPNMMNINSRRFEKKYLSQLISLEMGIGFAGFGLLTPFVGYLIDQFGAILFPIEAMLGSMILLILFRKLNKIKPLKEL